MKTVNYYFLTPMLCLMIFCVWPLNSPGQEDSLPSFKLRQYKIAIGPEYIWPSNSIQTIQTISFNAFFWTQYFEKVQLDIALGVTITGAWGKIQDWYSIIPPYVYHKTSAFGAGPVFHFQHIVFKKNRFTVEAEASGGLILYNTHFPYGGDIYNFMVRAGGLIGYRINSDCSLYLGYKGMHVSNGKGLGDFNPTYEGKGISLTYTNYFFR